MMLSGCAGQCGYSMAPIKEVLLAARNKYHDVLSGTMTQAAARAVNEDDLHRVRTVSRCAPYIGTAAVLRMVLLCLHVAGDAWGRMATICIQGIIPPTALETTCCKSRHMLCHLMRVQQRSLYTYNTVVAASIMQHPTPFLTTICLALQSCRS